MKTVLFLVTLLCLPWSMISDSPHVGDTSVDSTGGIGVVLTPLDERQQRGKSLHWDLRFQNTSDQTIPVAEMDNVLLNVIGPDGQKKKYLDDVRDYGSVALENWEGKVLQPGEYIGTMRHGPLKFAEPGKYVIWVTYYGPGFQTGVPSNRVTFMVE